MGVNDCGLKRGAGMDIVNPFERLGSIYYINMLKDVERNDLAVKEFERIGVPVERFEGIKHRSGWAGSTLSHRACIELGHRKGGHTLVFEDDVVFRYDRDTVWRSINNALDSLEGIQWDILYLGYTLAQRPEKIDKDMYRVKHGYGLYAYIVNEASAPDILNILETDPEKIAKDLSKVSDTAVYYNIVVKGNCYLVPVCSVRNTAFSNNWKTDRGDSNGRVEEAYRKYLN